MQDLALTYRLSEGGANEKVNLRVWKCHFDDIALSSSWLCKCNAIAIE